MNKPLAQVACLLQGVVIAGEAVVVGRQIDKGESSVLGLAAFRPMTRLRGWDVRLWNFLKKKINSVKGGHTSI